MDRQGRGAPDRLLRTQLSLQGPPDCGRPSGHEALRAYLTGLFGATPPMRYTPDETWPIPGGFCGRWFCAMGDKGELGTLRGFDLVIMDGERIGVNEVYVHTLPAASG